MVGGEPTYNTYVYAYISAARSYYASVTERPRERKREKERAGPEREREREKGKEESGNKAAIAGWVRSCGGQSAPRASTRPANQRRASPLCRPSFVSARRALAFFHLAARGRYYTHIPPHTQRIHTHRLTSSRTGWRRRGWGSTKRG